MKQTLTKARHPHICPNEHSDGVVGFLGPEIVIPDEHDLHPAFPLFRLIAVQQLVSGYSLSQTDRDCDKKQHQKCEQVTGVTTLTCRKVVLVVTEVVIKQDASEK